MSFFVKAINALPQFPQSATCSLVRLSPLLRLCQGRIPSRLNITLGQPFACFYELDDIKKILDDHDGRANPRQDPGPGGIHLVGPGHLQRCGAVGIGE